MILATGRAAPLRFLIVAIGAWICGRGVVIAGWQPDAALQWGPPPGALLDAMPAVIAAMPPIVAAARTTIAPTAYLPPERPVAAAAPPPAPDPAPLAPAVDAAAGTRSWPPEPASAATGAIATPPLAAPPVPATSPLSGSAWAFVRGGAGSGLSPDGQIGGAQAGVRLLYRVTGGLSAAARLSSALRGPRQTEAALGLDWQPVRTLPVRLMLDRRIAIDRGGRDAWAAGVAGGAYAVAVAPGVRFDGYAQAGVVGARRRDLFGDGAARIGGEIDLGERRSLTLGGGVWGAAQPGATRLDAGPSAVLRLGTGTSVIAAALEWRERIAGGARPGSGPALTVGLDF